MIKIVLSIRSLDIGGAERQFIELVKHIDKKKFEVIVCTMYGGVQEDTVKDIPDITYYNLQKKGRYDLGFYSVYKKLLYKLQPDIIYSFLGEMNLFSLWCKPKSTKVIWGFRASNLDLKKYGRVSQFLFWLQKQLSPKVDLIITNSNASIEFHEKEGFFMDRAIVIYNGIDTNRFKKDIHLRKSFREKFNLDDNCIAIGVVARIDYMKGYTLLANSAKDILDKYENIIFFSIGDGDSSIKKECGNILDKYNNTKFIWLGKQKDVEKFYSGFDILVSSSFGEGFSNSIAEAMSCEVPCVVTDVGESKIIVDKCGEVVSPNDIDSLTSGIEKLLKKDLKKLGKCSRDRIVNNFSIDNMINKTQKAILMLLENNQRKTECQTD